MFIVLSHCLLMFAFTTTVKGFCGDSIRWSHKIDIENVYGMWYGVGYAQHTPDMTNKPNEVGCVTLHITDITTEPQNNWLDSSIRRHSYSSGKWRSHNNNPWSESTTWMDMRIRRKAKRDIYNERRLRVIWDEDGQSVEQTYVYTPNEAGLWVAEQLRPLEREMMARGIHLWNPNEPPKHPQVIRLLKVTPHLMILNHCSDVGGGVFSLILSRSPSRVEGWEWYDYKRQFFNFELPDIYRYTTICASCVETSSLLITLLCITILQFV